ncbi:hypothetical protein CN106_20365 [Sinorhizobium meliloti]|nr:hypothetical protein CN205_22065 [Sinorhizobium meliloti]RVM48442.1 hypothetical protein CN127_17010 [Sinorhizobium meliloti]RVN65168.1 hypothetical protein CN106_20365 [Sinorhizobium meliloti]RVO32046.1 hypothetical protein CN095_21020 [Sinorhizobium meliloti]
MFRQIMQITVFMATLIARRPAPVKRRATCKRKSLICNHDGHGFVTIWLIWKSSEGKEIRECSPILHQVLFPEEQQGHGFR